MDSTQERQIFKIVDTYVRAFETADADLLESLFWTDDSRFSEIENDRPKPFGRETFQVIRNWIREHGQAGGKMRFYETAVHFLSPEVAYSTSMRDEFEGDKPIPSRVTLIFLRKEDEWKIIHGHFSYLPQ